LGICHEDIEALMLAFKDKFMDAVIQSEGLSISRVYPISYAEQ
jgi:hypothetical protein